MKKVLLKISVILLIVVSLSSCATVFGGHISNCQKTRPYNGRSREVRPVALVADILLFWPGTIVDFATGAIYRPCNKR